MIKGKKMLVVSAHAADYVSRSGGTIAKFVSHMDVDTVDLGVPVLSMHSPFELTSKLDVFNTYKAFKAFNETAE